MFEENDLNHLIVKLDCIQRIILDECLVDEIELVND